MKEIRNDAHLIWVTLKDIYDEVKCDVQIQELSESIEGCTISSSETETQMSASKNQESKDSPDSNFTPVVAAYLGVLDMVERLKDTDQMISLLLPVLLSYIMITISALWPCPRMNQTQIVIVMMMRRNLCLSLER
jgi:hypothetical protein